ncbi:MAG: hypothetical protein B6245_09865 [Desulfobacteraceae bacterium 4572_88]|nr:MAG: hypothetical protein B6245_09865 [Desulfobacteraceae bacterium 4572_88]
MKWQKDRSLKKKTEHKGRFVMFAANREDPYKFFTRWCLSNGFGDVINCNAKEVNLRRLRDAINQYVPMHRMTQGRRAPLSPESA